MQGIVSLLADIVGTLTYGYTDLLSIHRRIVPYLERYPDYVRCWANTIAAREPSQVTLLYRHLLTRLIMQAEIYPQWEKSTLPLISAALLHPQPHFTPLPSSRGWSRLTEAPNVINTLRSVRLRLQQYHLDLANRHDVTDAQLVRDHGMLSAFLLLYALTHTCVLLEYEQFLRPTDEGAILLLAATQTLTELKGVLFHGETRWLCPHVR